eukprot:Tamp_28684.p1 GENE.Tamp_28684~~Tamp_28684.p1  ORF type:complete len:139 (-),score=12.74 Tamp_28684:345-761(-)
MARRTALSCLAALLLLPAGSAGRQLGHPGRDAVPRCAHACNHACHGHAVTNIAVQNDAAVHRLQRPANRRTGSQDEPLCVQAANLRPPKLSRTRESDPCVDGAVVLLGKAYVRWQTDNKHLFRVCGQDSCAQPAARGR